MDTLDKIMSDRDAPESDKGTSAPAITDADRAANPLGTSKAERDHQGRFAPKSDKTDDQKTDTQQQKAEGSESEGDQPDDEASQVEEQPRTVPLKTLEAERRRRAERDDRIEKLMMQIAELNARGAQQQNAPPAQQQPEIPEFWSDPNAALEHRVKGALDPVNQRFQEMTLAYSQRFATQEHGAPTVQEAIKALGDLRQTNPGEYHRLETMASQSMDPVGDVVRWHKQTRALSEIGTDPDAYRKRLREEILAELQQADGQQANDPQQRQPAAADPQRIPSSFAGSRSGAPRNGGQAYGGPRSLSEIMPRG